jgi:hypothetical protein
LLLQDRMLLQFESFTDNYPRFQRQAYIVSVAAIAGRIRLAESGGDGLYS